MDVVELHLKRWMLLDEDNGLDVSVLKGFVVADIEHGYYGEDYCDKKLFHYFDPGSRG